MSTPHQEEYFWMIGFRLQNLSVKFPTTDSKNGKYRMMVCYFKSLHTCANCSLNPITIVLWSAFDLKGLCDYHLGRSFPTVGRSVSQDCVQRVWHATSLDWQRREKRLEQGQGGRAFGLLVGTTVYTLPEHDRSTTGQIQAQLDINKLTTLLINVKTK